MTPERSPRAGPGRAAPGGLGGILVLVGAVAGLLGVVVALRYLAEGAVASVVDWLGVGYAFAAGMVASVNPCGFLLLPAYVAHHLGTQQEGYRERSWVGRVLRALALGLTVTLGVVAVLGLAGAILGAGARRLVGAFPYVGVAVGVAMAGLGAYLLASGRAVGLPLAGAVRARPRRDLAGAFIYGVAYGLGSLSCALPIFFVVVGAALASGTWLRAVGQFVSYALGMGAVLVAVTVGAALLGHAVDTWLRRLSGHVHRVGALFLLGAGGYLVYYWLVGVGSGR